MNVTDQVLARSDEIAILQPRSGPEPVTRTHRQITEAVVRLSGALAGLGAGPGKRVMIVANTCSEMLESLIAVMRTGATAVPLSALSGAANLHSIIETMRPMCCVFDDPLSEEVVSALRASCETFISLRSGGRNDATHTYAGLVASPATDGRREVSDADEALIVHSSGSQGTPKGIRLTHGQIATWLRINVFMHEQYGRAGEPGCPRSPFISVVPLNHLAGIGTCLTDLVLQRTTCLMSHFVPGRFLHLVEESESEVLMLVPSMYRALLADKALQTTDLSSVRYCITMGEPCTPELSMQIGRAFGAKVVSAYGMTECFTGVGHAKESLLRGDMPPASCGQHLFGEVKLVDESGMENECFGELWVRNETVHPCYTDEERNVERFRDGWFTTGDLFERTPAGDFYHRGRSDDMFICNGRNIYPVEIEALLGRHPGIAQVCAAPVRTRDDKMLPAVLVAARHAMAQSEVQDFAARHGASHAVPRVVSFVERLPVVGPGKVNRLEARRLLQDIYDRAENESLVDA
jgi:long-chain acyl-CoA synthetase